MYLLFYINDILLARKDKDVTKEIKYLLSIEFEMKDLDLATKILMISIARRTKQKTLFLF